MTQGRRVGLSAAQKTDIWCRWKAGRSLHQIGRAFGKSHVSIHFLLSHHGGIAPAARRRSLLTLTLAEREDNGMRRHLRASSLPRRCRKSLPKGFLYTCPSDGLEGKVVQLRVGFS